MWLKRLTSKTPLRYFVAVCGGFAIDFLVYSILVAAGGSIYWANATAFCIGSALNVVLIRRFVFANSRHSLPKDILLTIAANGFVVFVFGTAMLWFLVEQWATNPYLAKLVASALTFAMNYFTRVTFFTRA